MLTLIQKFFQNHIEAVATEPSVEAKDHAYRLATAALLIEMSRADVEVKSDEEHAIVQAIKQAFDLTDEDARELIELAATAADQATSLFEFTRLINANFNDQQKEHIVELLWRVAFADGELDKYEEHLVRKVADLIYVPHQRFIRAKHRAKERFENSQRPL